MTPARLRLLAVLGAAACAGDGTGAGDVLVVAQVEITPPGAGLVVGGTQQFSASPRTSSGIPVPGRPVTWSSSDERIATISAGGLLTALALGEVIVTARVDQAQGSVGVNISPRPVASVSVEPATAGLQVGESRTLTAITLSAAGDTLAGRSVSWLSDAPAVASVSPSGLVTAVAAGQTVVRARSEGKEGTAAITVTPRPATRLAFTTQPANGAAGQAFGPVRVAVQDEIGGTVTGSTAPVTLELSDNPGDATLGGTLTVNAVAGIATFTNLVITRASAGYVLRATSGSLSPALSNPFTITAGPAAALGITTQPPAAAQSGLPLATGPVVQIQDAHGNPVAQAGVQITAALSAGNATLGGSLTATTGTNGAASFPGLVISGGSGTYQLRFTASGLTAAVSTDIVLAASVLRVSIQPPAGAVNGAPLAPQPAVRILDLNGTPVAQAGVAVTVSLSGTGAILTGTLTATTNGSGVATFTGLTLTGILGTFRLVFAAPGFAPVSSDIITLGAGPPARIRIAVQPPAGAASGAPFNPQPEIQVVDQSGNPAAAAGIDVSASLATGTGTLGGTTTAASGATGRAVFTNLAITGPAGSYTLRFSTADLGSVDSDPVTIGAGSPARLSMAQQPSASAQSGVAFGTQPAVQLRDGADNPVSLAGVTITAGIASGGGTLIGTATATTNGSGIATFSGLGISGLVGDRTLQFTAAGLTAVQSSSISITPGPAARLALAQQPASTAASGAPFAPQPTVQLQDAAGNSVSQAGVAVSAGLAANAGGTLGGGMLVLTNASGQAVYADLAITGSSGNYTLRFTSGTLTAVESNAIALGAGAGSTLAITAQPPASVKNGAPFGATIQLQDAANNPVAQAGVVILVNILSGGGTLGGDQSVSTDATGQAVFDDLTITGSVGDRTLIFAAGGYTSATSNPIAVTPGDPKVLAITTQPAGTGQSGVALDPQPVIHLEDQSGNAVSQAGVQITASLASGSGTISAGGSASTNGSGLAGFTGLTISGPAGVKTIGFAAAGLTGTTSGAVTLSAGPARVITNVAPLTQSAAVNSPVPSAPSVLVTDGFNPVAGVDVTFTVTQGGGSSNPASPAVIATNGSGVAALTSWTLGSTAGTSNNAVTAAAGGLQGSPVTFTASATAGAAASIEAVSDVSQTATAGGAVPEPPSVRVTDAGGNPVSGVNVTFSVTAGGGSIDPASPAVIATNGSGVATLISWTLGGTAGANAVQATAGGLDGSPVAFTANGTVGAAANIAAQSDPSQSATVGTPVAEPPSVKVTDAGGNPVAGVTVTFAVAGGGTIDPADGIRQTDAGGVASLTSWTLGTTAGANTVTASAAGVPGQVQFSATGTAGAAVGLTANSIQNQSATVNTAVATPPSVRVTDIHDNGVAGVQVTFAITGGGGTTDPANGVVTTGANGVATLTGWTLGAAVGDNDISATAAGVAGDVPFAATGIAGAAAALSLTIAPPATVATGVLLAPQPVLAVTDAHGNPVAPTGVTVSLVEVAGGPGTLDGTTTVTTVSGVATFTDLTITGPGTYKLRFVAGAAEVEADIEVTP